MPTTIEIHAYTIDELDENAREKAIEAMYDINVDIEWYDYLLDYWKEKLAAVGLLDADINFSGFSYQGDGASFTCQVDIPTFIKAHKLTKEYRSLISCIQHGRYASAKVVRRDHRDVHKYTITVDDVEIERYPDDSVELDNRLSDAEDRLEDSIISIVRDYCDEIYDNLREEYYYLTSEEAIVDTIQANEYLFTKEGKRCLYL